MKIYCDGACSGNPGPAGIAYIIYNKDNNLVCRHAEILGNRCTNNQAEYEAMLLAVKHAKTLFEFGDEYCEVFSDSNLIVRQINYEYDVNDAKLFTIHRQILNALNHDYIHFDIKHIPKEENKEAHCEAQTILKEYMKCQIKE